MNFISKLNYASITELTEILYSESRPNGFFSYSLVNEIKPIDLYCYFYAKFGPPNGLQNFLRNDSSDNLVHWEWTFLEENNLISFQSLNMRTEIHFVGHFETTPSLDTIIEDIKNDFQNYGKEIKEVRTKLEKWTRFVNPFNRLHLTVKQTIKNIEKLNLNIENDRPKMTLLGPEEDTSQDSIEDLLNRYNNAVCYYFSLKSMLPIMAESFVNLVIYILAKNEIKKNDRLFQNVIRQQIDIRIQSLHINCVGFQSMIDYSNEHCKRFHSIINERNNNHPPPRLSRFESMKIVDGKMSTICTAAPFFYRATLRHCHQAKILAANTYHPDSVMNLHEIYEERCQAIVMAIICLEAVMNEAGNAKHPNMWGSLEKLNLIEKINFLHTYSETNLKFDTSTHPWQGVKSLNDARNKIVHFKHEYHEVKILNKGRKSITYMEHTLSEDLVGKIPNLIKGSIEKIYTLADQEVPRWLTDQPEWNLSQYL